LHNLINIRTLARVSRGTRDVARLITQVARSRKEGYRDVGDLKLRNVSVAYRSIRCRSHRHSRARLAGFCAARVAFVRLT